MCVSAEKSPAWTRRRKRRQHSRTQLFSSVMHLSFIQRQRKALSPAPLKIRDDVGDYVFPVAESQRMRLQPERQCINLLPPGLQNHLLVKLLERLAINPRHFTGEPATTRQQ